MNNSIPDLENPTVVFPVQKPYELTPEEKKEIERKTRLITVPIICGGYIGPQVARTLAENQICLNTLIPGQALELINANTNFLGKLALYPLTPLYNISALKTMYAASTIITLPIVEEIEVRFLFQELLLRWFPKAVLNKCAPKYAYLVEAKAARIARVALSTLLFALLHTGRAGDHKDPCLGSNYGIAVLGLGASLGGIAEEGGGFRGVAASMAIHSVVNAIAYAFGNTSLDR